MYGQLIAVTACKLHVQTQMPTTLHELYSVSNKLVSNVSNKVCVQYMYFTNAVSQH